LSAFFETVAAAVRFVLTTSHAMLRVATPARTRHQHARHAIDANTCLLDNYFAVSLPRFAQRTQGCCIARNETLLNGGRVIVLESPKSPTAGKAYDCTPSSCCQDGTADCGRCRQLRYLANPSMHWTGRTENHDGRCSWSASNTSTDRCVVAVHRDTSCNNELDNLTTPHTVAQMWFVITDESLSGDPAQRKPCPQCNSLARAFSFQCMAAVSVRIG